MIDRPGAASPVELDVSGRPLALVDAGLERYFRPRSLAVVGASNEEGRPNAGITRQLERWAERMGAELLPVNPKYDTVSGRPCVASVLDLPEGVDVAVILLADPRQALAQCVERGVRFAVAFAGGFAEQGAEGRRAQEELAAIAARGSLRLLGPNTNLNAFELFRDDLTAPAIALISQSGHQGRPVFQAQEIGIRLSHWAPTGNEADLEVADFISYFADQPEVGAIAVYVEGFKDGRRLLLATDHAASRGVPVVMVKVGRTAAGRSMAASHTGKLAGVDAVAEAALRQAGVIRVDGLDELIDSSQLLARARPPHGDGVVVYSISGGTGAHMADICAGHGLRLPELSASTQETLWQWIPRQLRVSNPVDNGGHPVGDWRGRKILDAIVADPATAVLVAPITGAFPPMSDRLAQDLVDVAETTEKPICVVWGSPVGTEAAYRDILLSSERIAVFRTFANCARAVRDYLDYHELRLRYSSPFPDAPRHPLPAAATVAGVVAGRQALSELESKEILRAYGIATPAERLVTDRDEARRAASEIGYPVVLKASGAGLAHKSDAGLVRLGLSSEDDVARAFDDVTAAAAAAAAHATGRVQGMLVAEQVAGGTEVVVGLNSDPVFGPTVMVGLGGVFVEVLGDVAFRVAPFARDEARRMLLELRGLPLLTGARGRPPADIESLLDVILAVQRIGLDNASSIRELDINPLIVRCAGRGSVAVDALVVPYGG